MTPGTFFAVVGPSGAGKDSVMRGVAAARRDVVLAQRVITRPADASEDFLSVSEAVFASMEAIGAFARHWQAHGLSYGIPASVLDDLAAGHHVLANLSRTAVPEAARLFRPMVTLHVTASPAVLAGRLALRGRESQADIARRLERANYAVPGDAPVVTIVNDGALDEAVSAALAALPQPVRG